MKFFKFIFHVFPLIRYFANFTYEDFARAGFESDEDIVIPMGELSLDRSMLDHLRKQGMIVELELGKIILRQDFIAATAGEPLTPEQCRVLKLLDRRLVQFSANLLCHWGNGEFEEY